MSLQLNLQRPNRPAIGFKLADDANLRQLAEGHIAYESEVVQVMWHFVRPGDKVIDCGANLGILTLLLSQLVGGDGAVLAFEPDKTAFDKLVANVELNQASNVVAHQCLLWSNDGPLQFFPTTKAGYIGCGSFIKFDDSDPGVMMDARALDSMVGLAWGPVRLLKIDCEGAEPFILSGAEQLLRRGVDAVIIEFNFYLLQGLGITTRQVREYMRMFGYEMFALTGDGERPRLIPFADEIGETGHLVNVLFSTVEKVEQAWE